MKDTDINELDQLRAENARLRALLAQHGIVIDEAAPSIPQKRSLSLEEKVNLFRSLFQGREDVFARDGSAIQPERVDINRYVAGNGTVSFATKRNSNERNVSTANFNLWNTMTFTVTLKAKILTGEMSLAYMPFCRTIPVGFYVVISMTRAVSMVIKRM